MEKVSRSQEGHRELGRSGWESTGLETPAGDTWETRPDTRGAIAGAERGRGSRESMLFS